MMKEKEPEKNQPNKSSQETNVDNFSLNSEVFLQRLYVELKNNEGKERTVRAILDSR